MKKFLFLIYIFIISTFMIPGQEYQPIVIKDLPSNMHIEIRPEIELLFGVLYQTSFIKIFGPKGEGNEYFRELKNFFSKYKDHEAIKIAEKFIQSEHSNDKYYIPLCLILNLGSLPDLKPMKSYNDYLLKNTGSKFTIEKFRNALIKLAEESNFKKFLEDHRIYLEQILNQYGNNFNGIKVITWLEQFYGSKGDEYYIIFTPAFPFGGGDEITVDINNGKKAIYEIVHENNAGYGKPQFPKDSSLERLTFHEWGHFFVNPAIDEQIGKYPELKALYAPVSEKMKKINYNEVKVFIYEQVLRSIVFLATENLDDAPSYERALKDLINTGFYLTEFTISKLQYYTQNRNKYPSFKNFVPYLLESYSSNLEVLEKKASEEIGSLLPEIKNIEVLKIYWIGDLDLKGVEAEYPNSILLEVKILPNNPRSGEQIETFLKKAGFEFELVALGEENVKAKTYQGNIFKKSTGSFWYFLIAIVDKEFSKLKPGIIYKLIPKAQNPEYKWIIGENITITLPESKNDK